MAYPSRMRRMLEEVKADASIREVVLSAVHRASQPLLSSRGCRVALAHRRNAHGRTAGDVLGLVVFACLLHTMYNSNALLSCCSLGRAA